MNISGLQSKLSRINEAKSDIKEALEGKRLEVSDKIEEYAELIGGLDNTTDATATADELLKGKTAYVKGNKIEGKLDKVTPSNITAKSVEVKDNALEVVGTGYQDTVIIEGGSDFPVNATFSQVANAVELTANKLKKGVTILGVAGTVEELNAQEKTITPAVTEQVILPDAEYNAISKVTVEAVTADIDENLIPTNIRAGVTVLGVEGNLEPDKPDQEKTVKPTTEEQIVVGDVGFELAKVTVEAVTADIDANIKSENIKSGVTILGVTGKSSVVDTVDATATAVDILTGKSAYINGAKVNGAMLIHTEVEIDDVTISESANVITIEGTPSEDYEAGYVSSTTSIKVTVEDADLVDIIELEASDIMYGSTVLGVAGTATGDGDIQADDVAVGKIAYSKGQKVTGTLDLTELDELATEILGDEE